LCVPLEEASQSGVDPLWQRVSQTKTVDLGESSRPPDARSLDLVDQRCSVNPEELDARHLSLECVFKLAGAELTNVIPVPRPFSVVESVIPVRRDDQDRSPGKANPMDLV
jgi:hypothetical protein